MKPRPNSGQYHSSWRICQNSPSMRYGGSPVQILRMMSIDSSVILPRAIASSRWNSSKSDGSPPGPMPMTKRPFAR